MIDLNALPLWQSCILILGGGVGLVVGGHFLVRRVFPHQVSEEVSGLSVAIMQVVAAFIGIMLAFAAVEAWQDYGDADAAVAHESATTAQLYRDLRAYGPETVPAREAVEAYVHSVLEEEWPGLAEGRDSLATGAALTRVFDALAAIDPQTPRQQIIYAEAFQRLNEVVDHRRSRLIASKAQLPGLFWAVIILGSMVIVAYTFVTPATWPNAVIIGGLVLSMGLIFVFILAVDHPFAGAYAVGDEEMRGLLGLFDRLRST